MTYSLPCFIGNTESMRNLTVGLSLVVLLGTSITIGNVHVHENERLNLIIDKQIEIIKEKEEMESILRKEIDRLKQVNKIHSEDIENINTESEKKTRQLELLHKEIEKLKKQIQSSPTAQMPSRGEVSNKRKLTVEMTAYTSECKGCTGFTFIEYDVRNTIYYKGMRVVAMDTKLVPLHSIVKIHLEGNEFYAAVIDKGGAIKGKKLDLLVNSYDEAIAFGRKQATITVIREGDS